jgi:phosphatidate cytidylyltransferase
MILRIYFILLLLFALGGIAFFFINRHKEFQYARNNWIKYITYFFIINTLFVSIVFLPQFFRWVVLIIILTGFFEMVRLYRLSGYSNKRFYTISILLYSIFCIGFYRFSGMDSRLILFVFLILSIFDAFSQITGQLAGKTKLFPKISPAKTLEGLAGGAFFALAGSMVFRNLTGFSIKEVLLLSLLVVIGAFLGDMASSFYKRKSNVKDFSTLIPGHGGILDRFDSFIVAGAFFSFLKIVIA